VLLREPDGSSARQLAKRLSTNEGLRHSLLRDLLPGLDLIESSAILDRLGTRATNCLTGCDIRTSTALAQMTPAAIHALPAAGTKTVEEILLVVSGEWASAYQRRDEDAKANAVQTSNPESWKEGASNQQPSLSADPDPLMGLLGRTPDGSDRRLLQEVVDDPEREAARRLAEKIHTDSSWSDSSLQELMPGLGLVEAPGFFDRLGVRAANVLGRAGLRSLSSLASLSPAELHELPHFGNKGLEEVLAAVFTEWALAYLGHKADRTKRPEKAGSNGGEISECLRRIEAWGTVAHGTEGSVEAIVAAARAERLPNDVEHALRRLDVCGASTSESGSTLLGEAFEQLERTAGFLAFRHRQLEAGPQFTLKELAAKQGLSHQRLSSTNTKIRALLLRLMRDRNWPVRIAVDEIRHHLGSVAHPQELDEVFSALDPDSRVLSSQHRRALLLWLGDYRLTEEWLIGPDIEALTGVILDALVASGPASLDAACRQLALLGVREELQVPWILSRHGFRVIDGKLVGA
jgi:Bacterial RNA polymerase, alpha chain C terminal domain